MSPMNAAPLAIPSGAEQELDQEFELDIRISTQVDYSRSPLNGLTDGDTNCCPITHSNCTCGVSGCNTCTCTCGTCGTDCTCRHPAC